MFDTLPTHPRTGLLAVGWCRDGRPIWPILGGDRSNDEHTNPVLARLLEQRAEQETFIDQLLAQVQEGQRDLVDAERANLEAARQRIAELDQQITPLEEWETQRAAHRANSSPPLRGDGRRALSVQEPPPTYRSVGEFVVDAIRAHGYPGEQYAPDAEAQRRVAAARGGAETRATVPNQTTVETPGLLPEPIVGQILTDLDASRPFVTSVGVLPLAGIPGKIFTRPHVTQHTQVGEQTAEKTELPSRQYKVEGLPFTKRTFGGWLNVSRQDIDWTSPSAWTGLTTDLQNEYGADTDDIAGDEFAAGVTQTQALVGEDTDIGAWVDALYAAAVKAATANGTKRARALRLPNHIWVSIDMWGTLGAAIDRIRATQVSSASPGFTTPMSFAGDILSIPRTVVAGFPAATTIVGRTSLFEFYEERIGVLQAIEPKVLGVEVAYGGYAAWGFLDPTAFCKITAGG